MYMSRIRGPYVRFCERDEAQASPYSMCALINNAAEMHVTKLQLSAVKAP